MVAVDLLLGRRPEEPRPDVVLSIVDATNLDRHLYLTSQLLDLGEPVVVAVNMIDAAEAQGIKIDCAKLAEQLGVPVVPIQANKGIGLARLDEGRPRRGGIRNGSERPAFPSAFEEEVGRSADSNSATKSRRSSPAGCCSTSADTSSNGWSRQHGDGPADAARGGAAAARRGRLPGPGRRGTDPVRLGAAAVAAAVVEARRRGPSPGPTGSTGCSRTASGARSSSWS